MFSWNNGRDILEYGSVGLGSDRFSIIAYATRRWWISVGMGKILDRCVCV